MISGNSVSKAEADSEQQPGTTTDEKGIAALEREMAPFRPRPGYFAYLNHRYASSDWGEARQPLAAALL